MTQTTNTQAIELADLKAMLVAPTVPAEVLERDAKQLAALVREHGLDMEAAEMVAFIRREHGCQMATVGRYLAVGNSIDRIVCAYEARTLFDETGVGKGKPSLGAILEAVDYFADSEDTGYFQELLLELPNVYPNLEYNDTIVKVALEEAREMGILYLGDLIDRKR